MHLNGEQFTSNYSVNKLACHFEIIYFIVWDFQYHLYSSIYTLFHIIIISSSIIIIWWLPWWLRLKNLPAIGETQVQSLGQEDPWRRKWQPTPVLLPRESHGQRSLAGYRTWDCKELDTIEWLTLSNYYLVRIELCITFYCQTYSRQHTFWKHWYWGQFDVDETSHCS